MIEYIIKVDDDRSHRDINGGMPLLEKPEELVRCADCKFRVENISDVVEFFCVWMDRCVSGDWYCAYAVKRKKDAD